MSCALYGEMRVRQGRGAVVNFNHTKDAGSGPSFCRMDFEPYCISFLPENCAGAPYMNWLLDVELLLFPPFYFMPVICSINTKRVW
jgi:hypothetical protein